MTVTEPGLLVAMIDGKVKHGGLCDRFKGIISLYAYSKVAGRKFKIRYTSPFLLEKMLQPSSYDWALREGEYSDYPGSYRILYMRKEYKGRRLFRLTTRKQVHFYSNRDMLPAINLMMQEKGIEGRVEWGSLFKELFKPSPNLEKHIKEMKKITGENYLAAVFRFQNLLNDFNEYHFRPLESEEKQQKLITKCLYVVRKLRSIHNEYPLLVTSDSRKFLDKASEIEGVVTIPGRLIHVDMSQESLDGEPTDADFKSFTDFYMLSGARKIYRVGTSQMYPSEFPLYAAKLNNVPFETLDPDEWLEMPKENLNRNDNGNYS